MTKPNVTHNQHYICQSEQRLNAIPSTNEKRIHSFVVISRKEYKLKAERRDGAPIVSNMAGEDLFSFSIDKSYRTNLEVEFQRFEEKIRQYTEAACAKLRAGNKDVRLELEEIYHAKQMNSFRNPHCIRKTLNTFPEIGKYRPTDPGLLALFAKIDEPREGRDALCEMYSVDESEYKAWLRALLILFAIRMDGRSMFEHIIGDSLRANITVFRVYLYDEDEVCLLSDRGFNELGSDVTRLVRDFNLSSTAFARVWEAVPGSLIDAPQELLRLVGGHVEPDPVVNDLNALEGYNRHTVYQCAKRVFGARMSPRGIEVEPWSVTRR